MLAETGVDRAAMLGERVRASVSAARFPKRAKLDLDLSVGIAGFITGDSAASWVQRADSALYQAKQSGGGRGVVAA